MPDYDNIDFSAELEENTEDIDDAGDTDTVDAEIAAASDADLPAIPDFLLALDHTNDAAEAARDNLRNAQVSNMSTLNQEFVDSAYILHVLTNRSQACLPQ